MSTAVALRCRRPGDVVPDCRELDAATWPPDVRSPPGGRASHRRRQLLSVRQRRAPHLLIAEDDLTGRPGRFRFVTCRACGLAYQNPRLTLERRRRLLRRQLHRAPQEAGLGAAHAALQPRDGEARRRTRSASSRATARSRRPPSVLDVGCGSGSFLQRLRQRHGVQATGSRLQGPVVEPVPRAASGFTTASSTRSTSAGAVRRGDDVAFPGARLRSAAQPADGARAAPAGRPADRRGAAARQPDVRAGSAIAGRACRRRSTRRSSIARTSWR